MGIEERKKRHQDSIKKSILDASLKIAKKESWDAVSTRRLAEEIEYSTTAIYHYFGNKDAILFELQKDGFDKLKLSLIDTFNKFDNPSDRLLELSLSYYDFALNNTELYKLMFGIGVNSKETLISVSEEVVSIIKSELLEKLSKEDSDSLFINWWALSHGFVVIALMKKDNSDEVIKLKNQFEDALKRFISSV